MNDELGYAKSLLCRSGRIGSKGRVFKRDHDHLISQICQMLMPVRVWYQILIYSFQLVYYFLNIIIDIFHFFLFYRCYNLV
ncbi:hypothetical protein SAMN05660816_02036 [Niastella yeongjuensis]|nr:hypothetical protein SAMN05660816_02036 [Niastella yeongjuensis]